MKNVFAFIAFYFAVSLMGCQDTKEASQAQSHNISYYKSIGSEIPFETGKRWMDAYQKAHRMEGRLDLMQYTITASQLQSVLDDYPDLAGVAFHHATDNSGNHHFVVIPVGESLNLWSSDAGQVYIDANNDELITQATARAWTTNYQDTHDGEVLFHFFGRNIFDEILEIPYFTTLNIVPALNDLGLTPELLLIVTNEMVNTGGRVLTASQTKVYDHSNPCPPCPVQ